MNSPLLLELLLLHEESLLEEERDEDDDEEEEDVEEEDELTEEDLLRLRFRFFSSCPVNRSKTETKDRITFQSNPQNLNRILLFIIILRQMYCSGW